MISMLQAIAEKVGANLDNVPDVEHFREDIQPEKLVQQIERLMEQGVNPTAVD